MHWNPKNIRMKTWSWAYGERICRFEGKNEKKKSKLLSIIIIFFLPNLCIFGEMPVNDETNILKDDTYRWRWRCGFFWLKSFGYLLAAQVAFKCLKEQIWMLPMYTCFPFFMLFDLNTESFFFSCFYIWRGFCAISISLSKVFSPMLVFRVRFSDWRGKN